MIRENQNIYFTDEEKRNLTVKTYSFEEIKKNKKDFMRRINRKRLLLTSSLLFLSWIAITVEVLEVAACIGIVLLVSFIILFEIVNRLNYRVIKNQYYVEIIIEKKLDIEVEFEHSATTGTCAIRYYPVKGRDGTTNFGSIFYVDEEDYRNVGIGEKIRISVKGVL